MVRGTKRQAQKALNELIVSVEGVRTRSSTATLELLRAWLAHAGPSLSPTTLAGYRRLVDGSIVPALGSLLSAGVDVRTVSGRFGHANAATTLGV